jgi:type I restriction enzyme, S subunit
MKEGWREFCIGDAAEVFTGFPFEGSKYNDNKGIKVIRGENVTVGRLRWDTTKYWDNSFADKYRLQEGDIVIGMDGSRVGKNKAQIRLTDLPLLLAQRVARLRSYKSFDQNFLSYIINNERFENYISIVKTGTTIPHISSNQINRYKFLAPVNRNEQTHIASILLSLDDKIELNLQMNYTLEAIAQAIFKEWFVDFRFPGSDGELVDDLPKGWRKGHLSDILDLLYGKALRSEDRRQGIYPVIGSSGVVGLHDNFHVKGPGIVIGRKGTIGNVIWIHENFFPIDTTFFIKDLLGTSSLYYHFFLLRNQSFQRISSDSAVPGLNKNAALRNSAIVPDVEIVNHYNEIAKPIFERMNLIRIENEILTQLRDTLLPKLITGKLTVC